MRQSVSNGKSQYDEGIGPVKLLILKEKLQSFGSFPIDGGSDL
jgi:hypothetical protein